MGPSRLSHRAAGDQRLLEHGALGLLPAGGRHAPEDFLPGIQHDGGSPGLAQADGPVKETEHSLRIGVSPKAHPHPVSAVHAHRGGQAGISLFRRSQGTALQIAVLDLGAGLRVPLADQEGRPLPRPGMAEHRKARKICPLVLFPDLVFFLGIAGELCQLHCGSLLSALSLRENLRPMGIGPAIPAV